MHISTESTRMSAQQVLEERANQLELEAERLKALARVCHDWGKGSPAEIALYNLLIRSRYATG